MKINPEKRFVRREILAFTIVDFFYFVNNHFEKREKQGIAFLELFSCPTEI